MSERPSSLGAKPQIVFLVPTLQMGGAELHTVNLCQRLRDRGFDCTIVVHGRAKSDAVAAMPGASGAVLLNAHGISNPSGWARAWRTLRSMNPDIVVAVNQGPALVAIIERMLLSTRARIACIFHTTEMQYYEERQESMFRRLSGFVDLLIYVGDNQRRVWEGRGVRPRATRTISNGIELDRFVLPPEAGAEVRARFGIASDVLLLGIVAALRAEKNHLELVRALAMARDRGVNAELLVVGDGHTRGEIEALAQALGVTPHVVFAGEQRDVAPLIAACDIGAISSVTETFPLSALEFLASGKPVIASHVGGTPEIVHHGINGLLYESGDATALADAIVSCADPVLRGRLAGEARMSVARFSADAMTDAYVEAFEALLARKGIQGRVTAG